MRIHLALVAIVHLGLFTSVPTLAASFDCSKSLSNVERLICDDKELSELDDELAFGYKKLQGSKGQDDVFNLRPTDRGSVQAFFEDLPATQRAWISVRNACSKVFDIKQCLKLQYQRRILELDPHVISVCQSRFCEETQDEFGAVRDRLSIFMAAERVHQLVKNREASQGERAKAHNRVTRHLEESSQCKKNGVALMMFA